MVSRGVSLMFCQAFPPEFSAIIEISFNRKQIEFPGNVLRSKFIGTAVQNSQSRGGIMVNQYLLAILALNIGIFVAIVSTVHNKTIQVDPGAGNPVIISRSVDAASKRIVNLTGTVLNRPD
jgi:hypothetical protein